LITFNSETHFSLENEAKIASWVQHIIVSEGYTVGEVGYIFCNDSYLNNINKEFLNHDTLTDIISFDYCLGKQVNGEIYISIERVTDNAKLYQVSFENELSRVIIHGVLHFLGYSDKTPEEKKGMRLKENTCLKELNCL
jgi:rRNA maturation RNase YbeY